MMRMKKLYPTMKAVAVAGACFFLSACAGTGPHDSLSESRLNDAWKGRPVADAVGKWGKPMRTTPDGNGATSYQWMLGKSYVYDQYTGSDTQYTGESAQYHSDGRITYSPEYQTTDHYEKKRGDRICMLLVHADSSGRIFNLQTEDYDGGCSDFYSGSDSSPPDAAAVAKGKVFSEKNRTIKSIVGRYQSICVNPEYASLFVKSPCDAPIFQLAGAPFASKVTPQQKELLAKWYAEMSDIVKDYLAFFHSTGEPNDKVLADAVEANQARANPRGFLSAERTTADSAYQLSRGAKAYYQPYFN